jgi:hypothetical protein
MSMTFIGSLWPANLSVHNNLLLKVLKSNTPGLKTGGIAFQGGDDQCTGARPRQVVSPVRTFKGSQKSGLRTILFISVSPCASSKA